MKKFYSMALAFSLAFSLVACGNNSGPINEKNNNDAKNVETTETNDNDTSESTNSDEELSISDNSSTDTTSDEPTQETDETTSYSLIGVSREYCGSYLLHCSGATSNDETIYLAFNSKRDVIKKIDIPYVYTPMLFGSLFVKFDSNNNISLVNILTNEEVLDISDSIDFNYGDDAVIVTKVTTSFEGNIYELTVYDTDGNCILPYTNISEMIGEDFSVILNEHYSSVPYVEYQQGLVIVKPEERSSDYYIYSVDDNISSHFIIEDLKIIDYKNGVATVATSAAGVSSFLLLTLDLNTGSIANYVGDYYNYIQFISTDNGYAYYYPDSPYTIYHVPEGSSETIQYQYNAEGQSFEISTINSKYALIYITNVNWDKYVTVFDLQSGEMIVNPELYDYEIEGNILYNDYLIYRDKIVNLANGEIYYLDYIPFEISGISLATHYLYVYDGYGNGAFIDLDGDLTKCIDIVETN